MQLENIAELVLLGTGGGPKIWASRSQPASAVIVNDDVYIIDTGDGITAQLAKSNICLLYTSDAADDLLCVDLGGRRIIKKK